MDEEECACDALFPTVLAQGQEERQKFRSLACDPEENWMDGFMAGWFKGHFKQAQQNEPMTEPRQNHANYRKR